MEQKTVDQALALLKQYRDILVASYAPLDADGDPELRTAAQAIDPLEIAALEDIALLETVIGEMSA